MYDVLPFVAMMFGWLWALQRSKRYIVVSNDTIVLFDREGDQKEIVLANVRDVGWNFVTGELHLLGTHGQEVEVITPRFLGCARRTRLLANEVRRRLASM